MDAAQHELLKLAIHVLVARRLQKTHEQKSEATASGSTYYQRTAMTATSSAAMAAAQHASKKPAGCDQAARRRQKMFEQKFEVMANGLIA